MQLQSCGTWIAKLAYFFFTCNHHDYTTEHNVLKLKICSNIGVFLIYSKSLKILNIVLENKCLGIVFV